MAVGEMVAVMGRKYMAETMGLAILIAWNHVGLVGTSDASSPIRHSDEYEQIN
jgi:hypothetical protein